MSNLLRTNTPVEDHLAAYGLLVKREDLCAPEGASPFSKLRGVVAHLEKRSERVIGVLDTYHSQAGWAVAWACRQLGKECVNFYPLYKYETPLRAPQQRSSEWGAHLSGLPAGRSSVLYHQAKKELAKVPCREPGARYMMPNALKLAESVEETAQEVARSIRLEAGPLNVIVPSSSATICAGVALGLYRIGYRNAKMICHLGYSRSHDEVRRYVEEQTGLKTAQGALYDWLPIIDEGYAYKDQARPGSTPPWPCNAYYDLKAFRWWMRAGRAQYGEALFWNIG